MLIHKREFLHAAIAISSIAALPSTAISATDTFDPRPVRWRKFELTTSVKILNPAGKVRGWFPLAGFTAKNWNRPVSNTWLTNGVASEQTVGNYGVKLLMVDWSQTNGQPYLEMISTVATRNRSSDLAQRTGARLSREEHALYTASTSLIPTDGIVKATSDKITAGAGDDLAKARRIYEWIIANTFRDPKVKGCGLGNIRYMLETGNMGGKCADINALFVGLARAAGIPARDLYGIRVAPSEFGYKSLGANTMDVSKAQHCRAEVHLAGMGWIPVDPADVRKVVLEEPPGNLSINDPKVAAAHATLFGAWEGNWIAYNDGHDVALPGLKDDALAFLMYPQAENGGTLINCLDPASFQYAITAQEI